MFSFLQIPKCKGASRGTFILVILLTSYPSWYENYNVIFYYFIILIKNSIRFGHINKLSIETASSSIDEWLHDVHTNGRYEFNDVLRMLRKFHILLLLWVHNGRLLI